MKSLYTAVATSTGDGRSGHVATDDGLLDTDVRVQKELGGPGGATNPEQLFAAGYAACFHSALKSVARPDGEDMTDSEVRAKVDMGTIAGGGYGLAVTLEVHAPAVDRDRLQELTERAHGVCPYSNATRGNIEVTLSVV